MEKMDYLTDMELVEQNGTGPNLRADQLEKGTPVTRRVSQRNQIRKEEMLKKAMSNESQNEKTSHKVKVKNTNKSKRASKMTEKALLLHESKDRNIDSQSQDVVSNEADEDALFCSDDKTGNFQCGNCSTNFQSIELLSSHMDVCVKDNFRCSLCDKIFSTADSITSHLEEHNDLVKPFTCGICHARFFENATLLDHVRSIHDKLPALYKCNICMCPFHELTKLKEHSQEKHASDCNCKEFRCRLCGKCFSQGSRLSSHIQVHTKESAKLSKCPVCFSMLPPLMLKKHILVHEKEKEKTNSNNDLDKTEKKIGKTKRGRKKNESKTMGKNGGDFGVENNLKKVENEGTKVENDDTEDDFSEKGDREKRKGSLRQSTFVKKSNLAIKDTNKSIAMYMKIDPQSQCEVFDCDVCGDRLHDRAAFIQHRDDHFFDDKFCIHCHHCSRIFDSFENLYVHVGHDKCLGYRCDICGKSFALEPLLLTHQIKEHYAMTKGILTCTVCEKQFENRTAFLRHASSHSEDKCIECKLCRHAFTTPETLFGHLRTIHSLIPLTRQQYKFHCKTCDTKFMKNDALIKHMSFVHNIEENVVKSASDVNDSKFPTTKVKINNQTVKRTGHWRSAEDDKKRRTCPICNRVFRRFKDVRRHIGSHTKPYLCSHCGKAFPYRYSLDAHIKAFHSAENPHKCETCNKFFSCQRSLIVHQRIHTGEKPHVCNICQKRFRQVANLSMHIKLHNTEKPIKCSLCDYRCRHQGYLKRHMSTHSTEKKHFCPICNKGFTEKPNLNHHLKRHNKIKNHVCTVCGHRFAERYYLNNHMRIHTKEKPYVCPVCNRAFTMRPNMVSHIKKTHPSYNYQPIKRSNKPTANATSTISNNHNASEMDMLATSQNYSTMATMANMSFPHNSLSVISPTPHPLQTSSQAPSQPALPSHLPISTDNIPLYHHVTDSGAILKSDSIPLPTPRDLLSHSLPPQQEMVQQVLMRDPIIHRDQVGREPIAAMEQVIQRDTERHQHYINMTDRFPTAQFDPQREIPGQNFPSVHVHMDYMYTYPNMPSEPFLQGFFPPSNQHNPHTEPKP